MIEFLKLLIPRFQVDLVAMEEVGPDDYEPICVVDDLRDHDRPDIVARVKIFTWFNYAWPIGDKQLAMSWADFEEHGFPNETPKPRS